MKDSVIPYIKNALQSPIPAPKYQIHQTTKDGKIVGLIWDSIDYCWGQKLAPGWCYVIEVESHEHLYVHEDDVVLVNEQGGGDDQ